MTRRAAAASTGLVCRLPAKVIRAFHSAQPKPRAQSRRRPGAPRGTPPGSRPQAASRRSSRRRRDHPPRAAEVDHRRQAAVPDQQVPAAMSPWTRTGAGVSRLLGAYGAGQAERRYVGTRPASNCTAFEAAQSRPSRTVCLPAAKLRVTLQTRPRDTGQSSVVSSRHQAPSRAQLPRTEPPQHVFSHGGTQG
jgi:hypothetical protein